MSTPMATAIARLEGIVGDAHLLTQSPELTRYEIDGVRPTAAALPCTAEEVAAVVHFALAEKLAVVPIGARTKLRIGAPPRRYDLALDLTRLNRVLAYDPGDLTLGVEAGIPLACLSDVLSEKGQFLPLAPPFASEATIGGILATNSGSPLRHAYGAPRDYLLGIEFVTGKGVRVKSGGRVVKNVTGYDLHKLILGALGTLGVMTRVNFRTFPLPRTQTTFVASFLRMEEALALRRRVAESSLQPRLVEIVEPQAARILAPERRRLPAEQWSVVLAAAGHERVVERHAAELSRMAEESHAVGFVALADEEESGLLGRIREFPKHIMEFSPAATILKAGVLPSKFGTWLEQARQIAGRYELPSAALVRAVGIVYLALVPPSLDAAVLRRLAQACSDLLHASAGGEIGGHAVIEWCPAELKREVNVWGPVRNDLVLMRKLKALFDPENILSPGRFWGGI